MKILVIGLCFIVGIFLLTASAIKNAAGYMKDWE